MLYWPTGLIEKFTYFMGQIGESNEADLQLQSDEKT